MFRGPSRTGQAIGGPPGCSASAERQAASSALERTSSRSAASAALGAARSASACTHSGASLSCPLRPQVLAHA